MARTSTPSSTGDDGRPQASRIHTGPLARARLMQLGFRDPTHVREALQDGRSAARSAMTPDHPASYAGQRMWAETSASLAHLCGGYGWEHETFLGVDLVTNHEEGIAVIVTAGDNATGLEHYNPQVRYERKEVVTGLVNNALVTLWDVQHRQVNWEVWFLLHYLWRGELIVPAELSRPNAIDAQGLVTSFVERIIVPDFGMDGPGDGIAVPTDGSPSAPVVNVQRRAS